MDKTAKNSNSSTMSSEVELLGISTDTYGLPATPMWVKQKLSAQEYARYCVVRTICAQYPHGHAHILYTEMPSIVPKETRSGLDELAYLGAIRYTRNGTSCDIEIVEE